MRDLERWKDQVELSLDGRQIFFLFFGSAVAACVIFVAGVLVGKRIEQRACAPAATADPLAVLDQLESDEGLTFQRALVHRESQGRRAETLRPRRAEAASAGSEVASAGGAAEEGSGERVAVVSLEEAAAASAAGARKPEAVAPRKPEAAPAAAHVVKQTEAAPAHGAKKPEPATAAAKKPEAAAAVVKKPETAAVAGPAHGAKQPEAAQAAAAKKPADERYTLQISAFSEKSEADEFLRKVQAAGYRPYLVQSDIPGRGTFYRVRVGDYTTKKAALDAKQEFERRQRLPVYVAKL